MMNSWTEVLDRGGELDVYMDIQKAFDTVPHKRFQNQGVMVLVDKLFHG